MDIFELYQRHPQITTDSRNCPKDSIFIALKGATFDGNKFAASALEKGCSYAIIDNPDYAKAGDDRYIIVDDTLTAFKELAREHRRQFHIPVIGITGTNGKTTTKELISTVLAKRYRVMHTEGNFNNDVGVPKTLLRLTADDDIAVVEMGASHPGDIKRLVEYVEPTCGLITNVGHAHILGFGSFDGVKKTKGELYDFLADHDGLLFLNSSNEDLMDMAEKRNFARIITYGEDDGAQIKGRVLSCAPFLRFEWTDTRDALHDTYEVQTKLIGSYNLDNLLAAITVGRHFGVIPGEINAALEDYTPSNNRSQLETTKYNHLVVDAYNANPSSMKAALDNFKLMEVDNKMLILGDMRELGNTSAEEHQKVVDRLQADGMGPEQVWLVGEEFGKTDCDFRKFPDVEAVKAEIKRQRPEGHYILIKGSNSIKLFELPELL